MPASLRVASIALMSFGIVAGCGSRQSHYPPPEQVTAEPAPFTPSPEQAKARADAWAREDADAERHSAERAQRRAAEEAARAAEQERLRAELAANPFSFDGDFHAGRESCDAAMSLKFRDIRSLTRDCERCRCEYASRRTEQGTSWNAQCTGGKTGSLRRKLFVSNRRAEARPQGGVASWHATLEQVTGGNAGAVTCGYVGWMIDRSGEWEQLATDAVDVGAGYELPSRRDGVSKDPSLEP